MEEFAQLKRTGNDGELLGLFGSETPKPWSDGGGFQLPDEIKGLTAPQKVEPKPQQVESRPVNKGGIDLLRGWKSGDMPVVAGDRPQENPVKNGVLQLRYDDPNFDRKINGPWAYETLRITDLPPEVTVHHWIDDQGYFFWFNRGKDNQKAHHYPPGLKSIEVDGQKQDVDRERILVSEAYMAKKTGTGFGSMDGRTDVVSYFANMSRATGKVLDVQERVLRDAVQKSGNPYFRIYLADVLVAQSVSPIVEGVARGGNPNFNNEETLRKIDEALLQLREAQKLSRDELGNHIDRENRSGRRADWPPGNVAMPFRSDYWYYGPYDFYGGSLYQAQRREAGLTVLRYLISSGALNNIELPPALPPR